MSGHLRLRARFGRALLRTLAVALAAGHAAACGLEGNDVSLQRGAMNWAYPDSLHVLGAVAAAQHAGLLAAMPAFDATTPSASAADRYAMIRVGRDLWKMRARLAAAPRPGAQPALAIVLLEPMLWSRIVADGDALKLVVHVEGAAPDDVVVVTEAPVVAAIGDGRMSASDALSGGLMRLYGPVGAAAAADDWLRAADAPRPAARAPLMEHIRT